MFGLIGGFCVAVAIMLAANDVAGTFWALPFALAICGLAVLLAIFDPHRQ